MTPRVAVTQRVAVDPRHGERWNALDQRWTWFLAACGLAPLPLSNEPSAALDMLSDVPVRGVLLTGGNTLTAYGGDAPERDRTELDTIAFARARGLPVVGVCRGMQVILHAFGVPLQHVDGHSGTRHRVDGSRIVNSFHDFASIGDAGPFEVLARADDGVVEEIRHPVDPIHGVMWHPERCGPFADEDVRLFRRHFLGDAR